MIKVAYLLGSLNRGGTETLVLDVFKNASKASFEMIGIHRKGGAYQEVFYATGQKMIQCAPKRFGWLRYLLRLRRILQQEQVTVVHAQQPLDCIYAKLATIGTGIRVVETFHSYDLGLGKKHRIMRALSIRMADAVCFVSKAQRDYYKREYGIKEEGKLQVAYNGIDFGKFEKSVNSETLIVNSNLRLCMVGNFVRGRSQMEVLKALAIVKSGFDFYFIGRKSEDEAWRYDECVKYCEEHGLRDCVHFMGGRGDVPALLQQMDGFVYATIHDTFGIAVVEAMAAGVPVTVNDWDVMKEVTHDGEWATLYKTGDAEDCARAIRYLMGHKEEEKKKATQIAVKVREEYSIEKHMDRLAAIYGGE